MPAWVTTAAEWLKRQMGQLLVAQGKDFEREALTSSWTGRASLKRLLALEAGRALCACMVILVGTICVIAALHRSVDSSLVAALAILAPSVALLAGSSYRKPEGPDAVQVPPQPLPPVLPPATPHGGPK